MPTFRTDRLAVQGGRHEPAPDLSHLSAITGLYRPGKPSGSSRPLRIRRIPSLAHLVETTSSLTLEPWQHIICDRLQALVGQTGQRLLIHGPPQFGKPCYTQCMILMHDGTYRALGEIRVGDTVISHTGQPRRVTAVHEQGDLECVEIVTNNGRRTIAALDHPFLTPEGWVEAGNLRPEQVLANVPQPACGGQSDHTNAEFELLGYFVGDGHVGPAGPSIHAGITSNDPTQAERFVSVATSLGFSCRTHQKANTTALTYAFSGGVRNWLRRCGMAGLTSGFKVVPEWVFRGSPAQIGLFLGAYFSCDGAVSPKGMDRHGNPRPDATIEFYSISEPLLRGVQRLLLRVGVQARLSLKNGRYIGTKHTSYRLTFTTQDNVAQFASTVPVPGVKGEQLRSLRPLRRTFPPTLLSDPVVSVTRVGTRPCRCLIVETDHTFTVDDLVVHNSIIISQRFPIYTLGINPAYRVRVACYNVSHAQRFSRVNLDLMRAPEYISMFPDPGTRVPAIASIEEWSTAARSSQRDANPSFRPLGLGTGFTGMGVDTLVIDDPYKDRMEARSEATNAMLWGWWTDTVIPRMNPATNVVVMFHRWWEGDFAGRLLEQGGWELLRFPAIADGLPGDPTGRALGEPLSHRYPISYLEGVRALQGTSFEALYQGTPFPAEGGMFRAGRLGDPLGSIPAYLDVPRVRRWDIAASAGTGDYTAGVLMALLPDGRYVVEDVVRGQWEGYERDRIMRETAAADAMRTVTDASVFQVVPQDPAAAGKDMAKAFVRLLAGYSVAVEIESGSKVVRADPFSSQWNAGNVALVRGEWNAAYLAEMERFPQGRYDDQVDASSGAFNRLALMTGTPLDADTAEALASFRGW